LVTYPGVEHDFVVDGGHYNAMAYSDALTRTAAMLKQNLN
jgi:dienelactone hydrolase